MLALNSKIALAVLIGTISIGNLSINGQQVPSQRYQPTQQDLRNSTPPSVHVPPAHSRQLSASPNRQYQGQSTSPNSTGASYNFSDSTLGQQPTFRSPTGVSQPNYETGELGQVKQTSYEIDENGEPVVPEILAGAMRKPANNLAPPTQSDAPAKTSNKTPNEFSAQMQQIRSGMPRIAPTEFVNANPMRQSKELDASTQKPKRMALRLTSKNELPDGRAAVVAKRGEPAVVEESASEFISKLSVAPTSTPHTANGIQTAGFDSKIPSTASPSSTSPATMHIPEQLESSRDSYVRTASAETDAATNATIKLSAPSLQVETFGPQSIGINKPSNYKVVVKNVSSSPADRVMVAIDLPQWIDIENVNMTTGEKEIGDGREQARLLWKVDNVPGNGSQTITITAVPRKAEMFDMGIEWTLAPRAGATNIQVTQPKLEMKIVGPDEVQYGEQALYHVTVRNPGTGAAENVVVMLPEALGGERASLGNIAPGKDKNFQVELLARTAGQLELVATAVAEGNLEVAANRKLTVRRAILGITITGPGLKYAGSEGQYEVTISNTGDATANEIVAAMALPTGVQYIGGIESIKLIEGGLRWQVGSLQPGENRAYKVNCQLDTSGDLQLEVGTQAKGDLQAANACLTKVETVADLVLSVRDPKGPLPTGQPTMYEINVRNRGSRAAKGVNLVMQFSEGIEPKQATGLEHRLVPGQVLFSPIDQIEPGQEITLKVNAEAFKSGTHVFRAQLVCEESDSREIAEGTTRFFGEEIRTSQYTANSNSQFGGSTDSSEFQR